jgi:hypothetical protein
MFREIPLHISGFSLFFYAQITLPLQCEIKKNVELKDKKGYSYEEDIYNADDGDDGTGFHLLRG